MVVNLEKPTSTICGKSDAWSVKLLLHVVDKTDISLFYIHAMGKNRSIMNDAV